MRWLDSLSDSVDMNLSKLWEIVEDKGAWSAAVHGIENKSDTTEWRNSSKIKWTFKMAFSLAVMVIEKFVICL